MPAEGIFPAVGAVIGQSAKVAFSGVMPSIERMSSSGSGGSWSSGRGTVDVDALAVVGTDYEASGGTATWNVVSGFLPGSAPTRVRAPRSGITYLVVVNLYLRADPGDMDPVVGFSTRIASAYTGGSSLIAGEFNRAAMRSSESGSNAWTSEFVGVWRSGDELEVTFGHSNTDPVQILAAGNGVLSTVALIGMR